jgi:steroid Delta-isomerase
MPTEADMKATLQTCIEHWNAKDTEAMAGLFTDDAVIEDPYGTPAKKGKAAVRAFFAETFRLAEDDAGAKLALDTPIRGSHGDRAAMACTMHINNVVIQVITVMRFDGAGQITHMQGFWGPSNISKPDSGAGAPGAGDRAQLHPELH